jgi:hypothetical protein
VLRLGSSATYFGKGTPFSWQPAGVHPVPRQALLVVQRGSDLCGLGRLDDDGPNPRLSGLYAGAKLETGDDRAALSVCTGLLHEGRTRTLWVGKSGLWLARGRARDAVQLFREQNGNFN